MEGRGGGTGKEGGEEGRKWGEGEGEEGRKRGDKEVLMLEESFVVQKTAPDPVTQTHSEGQSPAWGSRSGSGAAGGGDSVVSAPANPVRCSPAPVTPGRETGSGHGDSSPIG